MKGQHTAMLVIGSIFLLEAECVPMSNDEEKDEHKDKNQHHCHREKWSTTARRPQSFGCERLRKSIGLRVVEILKRLPTDAASRPGLTREMNCGVTLGTAFALVRKHNAVLTNPTGNTSDLHSLSGAPGPCLRDNAQAQSGFACTQLLSQILTDETPAFALAQPANVHTILCFSRPVANATLHVHSRDNPGIPFCPKFVTPTPTASAPSCDYLGSRVTASDLGYSLSLALLDGR
jgi:hypothetical protein